MGIIQMSTEVEKAVNKPSTHFGKLNGHGRRYSKDWISLKESRGLSQYKDVVLPVYDYHNKDKTV